MMILPNAAPHLRSASWSIVGSVEWKAGKEGFAGDSLWIHQINHSHLHAVLRFTHTSCENLPTQALIEKGSSLHRCLDAQVIYD